MVINVLLVLCVLSFLVWIGTSALIVVDDVREYYRKKKLSSGSNFSPVSTSHSTEPPQPTAVEVTLTHNKEKPVSSLQTSG